MNPVFQKAKSQYQIQISQKDIYPFTGLKPSKFNTTVKLTLPFQSIANNNNNNSSHNIINKMCKIDNQNMIKIIKIIQSHLRQTYIIVYEYVPYRIDHHSIQIQQKIKNGKYRTDLFCLFQQILINGIEPVIKAQNFGFTQDYNIKMFVSHNWGSFICQNQKQVQLLATEYVNQFLKLFQSKQSSQKLKIKVTGLSQKLKKIQKQIIGKQNRKKQTKISSQGKNSSENSDSLAKTGSNQMIGNAQWLFDPDFQFQDSYSVRDSKKKRRSSSFKCIEKPKSESKQKKASWEASCKQQKSSNVQSDRITVLKKRISQALFKTQKTLTKYQKIRSKTGKNKQNIQALLNIPKLQ